MPTSIDTTSREFAFSATYDISMEVMRAIAECAAVTAQSRASIEASHELLAETENAALSWPDFQKARTR